MTSYSLLLGRVALEAGSLYELPALLIFRGALLEVDIVSRELIPRKFLSFLGTSSSFLLLRNDEGFRICSVEVVEEPMIYRNKLKRNGLFKVISCSPDNLML
ncbi:MAG TPA: hypothetical protein ENG05_01100 [Acidilobales archaeon]|nr:hypothetical protein [Acidilobales archaeon]